MDMAKGEKRTVRRRIVNAYISSVISISLVLLLVGVASLLLVNAGSVSDYFKENMQVSVLLDTDVSEPEALEFRKELESMADYVSTDSLEVVKKRIEGFPLVDEVVYQRSLVDALNANLSRISLVIGIFIGLLLFISFVLINNTVRLNVYARRFTIHTMRLVGATRSFIRGPFMVQAVFQGLFAAFVAIIMLLAILFFIRNEFAQLFGIFRLDLLLTVMGIVIAAGLVICVTSTYFVVNKLVSLKKDELYF